MRMNRSPREKGTAIIEFVLAAALFIVPLMLGTMTIGFNLLRATEVAQFTDDSAHMYSEGIDFSQTTNQEMLLPLSAGLDFSISGGGTGVLVFSTLLMVGASDCQAGGLQPNTASCPNLGSVVVTRRIVVGNSSVFTTSFGSPSSTDSEGNVSANVYLTSTADQANAFNNVLPLATSQIAYLTECYFNSPDYDLTGFLPNVGNYAMGVF
jgi:hypothetical protein